MSAGPYARPSTTCCAGRWASSRRRPCGHGCCDLFDDPDRDDRTWAISVAHSVSLRESDLAAVRGDLVRVAEYGSLAGEGALLFDHDEIVAAAVTALRQRYEIRYRYVDIAPDPDGFLPEPFALHQLRKAYEAVVGEEFHKDNFNRRMKPFLHPLTRGGESVLASNLRGRPATLYRRARPAYPSG